MGEGEERERDEEREGVCVELLVSFVVRDASSFSLPFPQRSLCSPTPLSPSRIFFWPGVVPQASLDAAKAIMAKRLKKKNKKKKKVRSPFPALLPARAARRAVRLV